jgi:hypothetical protein
MLLNISYDQANRGFSSDAKRYEWKTDLRQTQELG